MVINAGGQLGVLASSARYKRNIETIGARSLGLYKLHPVTFRYQQDFERIRQYGLVAEEVAKIYPELVTPGGGDQADPGEDLIRLDDDVVTAVDPLDPRRTGSASEMTVTTGKDANQPTPGHRLDHVSRAGRERAPAPFASRTL